MFNFPVTLFYSRRGNLLDVNILIWEVGYMLRNTQFTAVSLVPEVFL